jgi:hypothetical protein
MSMSMCMMAFRRILIASVIVVGVPATVGLQAASAATPQTASTVSCKKLTGSAIADTATMSGCTSSATGGSGAISNFLPTGGHVVWANSTTTDYTTTPLVGGTGTGHPCAATSLEIDLKGKVTASTNPAILVGSTVKMDVCLNARGTKITKKPASTIKF